MPEVTHAVNGCCAYCEQPICPACGHCRCGGCECVACEECGDPLSGAQVEALANAEKQGFTVCWRCDDCEMAAICAMAIPLMED